jgi:hypothetical protein
MMRIAAFLVALTALQPPVFAQSNDKFGKLLIKDAEDSGSGMGVMSVRWLLGLSNAKVATISLPPSQGPMILLLDATTIELKQGAIVQVEVESLKRILILSKGGSRRLIVCTKVKQGAAAGTLIDCD